MGGTIAFFFGAAALTGLAMAWKFSKGKEVGPLLITTHGSAAFLGLAILTADIFNQTTPFRLYFGYMALGFFAVTAILGIVMLSMHFRQGSPRSVFIIFHLFMALTAIFLLTAYLAPI